jgi:hypothetical protein
MAFFDAILLAKRALILSLSIVLISLNCKMVIVSSIFSENFLGPRQLVSRVL